MAEVRVEVVFALPGQALLRQVTLDAGATVQDAIRAAGFGEGEGVIDPQTLRVDAQALGLVGRMGGDLYCTTRDRFSLRRPSLDEGRAGKPIAPEPDPQSVA